MRTTPDAFTLLLVDDEEANLDLLEAFLRPEGFERLIRTSDARAAIGLFEKHAPDLVLLDLHMPHRSGFDVLEEIRDRTGDDEYIPVLVLTADASPGARDRALSSGAQDFLTKPLDAVEVILRVRNLLQTRTLYTAERRARLAAEREANHTALLAEASRALHASLDGTTALESLAGILVKRFADGCTITIDGEDSPRIVRGVSSGTQAERHSDVPGGSPAAGVVTTASGVVSLTVPLRGAGREHGRLVLERTPAAGGFDDAERALAEEIGQRAAVALETAWLVAEMQRAARARDHVLSVVAHDLRNPLTAIAAHAELLRHTMAPDGSEKQRTTLQKIEQIAWRTHQMVEDLLEISRLEQRPFALRAAVVEPVALIREAESMLQALAKTRSIALEFDGPPELPAILADGTRMAQVLSNLVGNALKFTPANGTVRVHWRSEPEEIVVCVSDTGPGIPVDRVPDLFRPFWQADPSDRRGVGLGLMIARAIVEAHGGRIWVESVPGSGATFSFSIPRDSSIFERAQNETAETSEA
jgi:signal transduction histidine kinase/DNA-binding response OmpR family regulator